MSIGRDGCTLRPSFTIEDSIRGIPGIRQGFDGFPVSDLRSHGVFLVRHPRSRRRRKILVATPSRP
jgi:hypothetical protein